MDVKEQAFIARFDTYRNAWNSTAGGQGRGWLVIMREARAKATLKRFETVYMLAFRDHSTLRHSVTSSPRTEARRRRDRRRWDGSMCDV